MRDLGDLGWNLIGNKVSECVDNFRMKIQLPLFLTLVIFQIGFTGRAETLFESNFGSKKKGEIAPNRVMADHDGVANFWQGPKIGDYGHFAITEPPEGMDGAADSSVLAIYDNSPEKDKAPTFSIRLSKEPIQAKTVVVEEKILIPIKGPYQALITIGKGSWNSAVAIFSLNSGKIETWQLGDGFTRVGKYSPAAWLTLKVVIEMEKKTYDVYVDGIKTGSAIPWAFTQNTSLTFFEVVSDLQPVDRMGEAVLYIEYVKITAD